MHQEPGFAGLFFFRLKFFHLMGDARCCERPYNFSGPYSAGTGSRVHP